MKTLKLSYSIINNWKQARFEEAIGLYLGKDLPVTPSIELGRLYDEKWNKYIDKYKKLPPELGGGKLDHPRTQVKYQIMIPLSDYYQILLRGVPDITEPNIITDNKCGITTAANYTDQTQLNYYSLFLPRAKIGRYLCYNPFFNELSVGIKFLTQTGRENALNEIITYGGEILDYLLANKLFKDYKLST